MGEQTNTVVIISVFILTLLFFSYVVAAYYQRSSVEKNLSLYSTTYEYKTSLPYYFIFVNKPPDYKMGLRVTTSLNSVIGFSTVEDCKKSSESVLYNALREVNGTEALFLVDSKEHLLEESALCVRIQSLRRGTNLIRVNVFPGDLFSVMLSVFKS